MRTFVRINRAGIRELNTPAGIIGRWSDELIHEASAAAKVVMAAKPYQGWRRSGRLEASIKGDRVGSNQRGVNLALSAGDASVDYAGFVHEGTTGPIYSHSGNLMPVGNTQGEIVAWSNPVAGQEAYPFLRMGMNVVLVRHQLRPIRE